MATFIEKQIKANGGTKRAEFGKLKVIRVPKNKVEEEDKKLFNLSGEVDVLIMIPQEDMKTKSGKEWPKGHYLVVDVQE